MKTTHKTKATIMGETLEPVSSKLAFFMERELERLEGLRSGLLGPYQREFAKPRRALLRLKRRYALDALNPYTRANWFRALALELAEVASARPPAWQARNDLFLVTLVDSRWSLVENEGELDLSFLNKIEEAATAFLSDVDFVGMVDIALYVSTRQLWGVPRRAFAHCHLVCWGTTLKHLKTRCGQFNKYRRGIIAGSIPAHVVAVNSDDLLQVTWYVTKAPRNQYQIQRKAEGGAIQRQRALAYVNHVRILRLLGDLELSRFVLANRDGRALVGRAMSLMRKWGHTAQRL